MVPHCNVNFQMGCEDCRHADARGMNCIYGLLFPVLALMAGYERCPNLEKKTLDQLEEKWRIEHEAKMETSKMETFPR